MCVLSPGWWEYGEIIFASYEIWLSRWLGIEKYKGNSTEISVEINI